MEFLNIGGGELIVIVLLAIILFGPEDILKIMRAIGGYVRKLQQMWAQVSSGLKGEFDDDLIPEEIQETIKETRDSVTEVQKTLAEVTAVAKANLDDTLTTVAEIKTSVETDIKDAKTTVAEIGTALEDVTSSVETSFGEIPKALEAATAPDSAQAVPTPTDGLKAQAAESPTTGEDM